jgi:hypothetical protein
MALENYEVVQEDGEKTHYQFDESDDVGKKSLEALHEAVKNPASPVKSVSKGDPTPINGKAGK